MEPEKTITVRHVPDNHCYELVDGETAIGKTEYVPASGPADRERIFYHTEVSDAYAGMGLAAVLAKHALDDTIAAGLTIIPVCPYIKIWMRRHPDYQQHAAPIRPGLPAARRTDPTRAPGRRRPRLPAVSGMGAGLTFEHITLGQRVLFGAGKAAEHLTGEIKRLGARNVMVISSARERPEAEKITAGINVTLSYDDVAPHVPVHKADTARNAAIRNGIDLLVSIGGGSATGLAKAIALTTGLPILAVPTTYAGSEATNVWGLTEASRKTTGVDDRVLPVTVIYDAELTLSLPRELSIASGLNALAHCIDSMWAHRTDPINQALAAEGIRALNNALPVIGKNLNDLSGREQALYGAYLSAVAFASAGSGMHHKICHVLGGRWNLPHAQTHAVVLPYVLAFNAPAAPAAIDRIAAAFGTENALEGLDTLQDTLGAPTALKDLGLAKESIAEAVRLILPTIPASNPRPVTEENLTALLVAAHAGMPG